MCFDVSAPSVRTATRSANRLDSRPGERLRIRSADEILATLDEDRKDRELAFEPEMLRHCGGTYRVVAVAQPPAPGTRVSRMLL